MAWTDVGIRHLRAFLAVSESLSFTQAAATLGTTQPSLTRSIVRLEQAMNVRLLDRTTRMVRLSPAGQELRAELHELIPRLELALSRHTDDAVLRLGFTWLLPDGWVQEAMARFESETGVPVSLVRNDERLAGVGHGVVDVALLRGDAGTPGMRVVRLGEEGQVAAVPVGSLLARRKRLAWAELAEQPLVMNTVSGIITTEDWPEDNRPSATVSCSNFDEWLELVAAGRGIGVAPELVLRRRLHPAVRFIPLYGAPTVPLSLVHPVQGADPLARRLVDVAGRAFADHHRPPSSRLPARRLAARPAAAA
ncbi:LysR family transcriptional regulator [Streptomyces sp. NPDC001153]